MFGWFGMYESDWEIQFDYSLVHYLGMEMESRFLSMFSGGRA